MVTRRNFIAAAAATVAAPVQALGVPVGGALRVPANFTKGKAVPEGFDFRDPFSGLFMSFSLWYVVSESGLAELPSGYPTPEAAYAAYLAAELAEAERHKQECAKAGQHSAFYTRNIADIIKAQSEPVQPAYFTEDQEKADLGVRMDENYMGASVVRGDMTYEFCSRYVRDESYGGDAEAVADFERAQNDAEWSMNWGGGC